MAGGGAANVAVVGAVDLLIRSGVVTSRTEARRLVAGGALRINGLQALIQGKDVNKITVTINPTDQVMVGRVRILLPSDLFK